MMPRLGSSSIRKRGRDISARAMASIWASPPLSVPARCAAPLAQDRKERVDPLEHLAPVAGIAVAEAARAVRFSATLSRLNRRRPSGTSATPSLTRSAASTAPMRLTVEHHVAGLRLDAARRWP